MTTIDISYKITAQLTAMLERICALHGQNDHISSELDGEQVSIIVDGDIVCTTHYSIANTILGVMCARITREYSNMKPIEERTRSCLDVIKSVASEYQPK